MDPVIYYTDDVSVVREDMLTGFFVGWPQRPSARQHLAVLRGSYRCVLVPYYARFGMSGASSALLRHRAALEDGDGR